MVKKGSAGEGSLFRAATLEELAITAIRKSLVAVGCTVALAAGSTACGSEEKLSSEQRVSRATNSFGERDAISVQLAFDTTPEQMRLFAEDKDDPMPPEAAEFLSKMEVTFSARSNKSLETSGEKDVTSSQLKLSGPGGDVAEYRLVDKSAYYRLNLKQFAKLSGETAPPVEELKSQLPEGFEAGKAILDGKWVKIDAADLETMRRDMTELSESEKGEPGSATPTDDPTLSAETSKKLMESLRKAFAGQVTLKENGRKDGADRVLATVPVRPLATAIVNGLRPIAKELPGGEKELPTEKDLRELPDNKATVDLALKGNELSGATLDLAEFDVETKKKLAGHGDGKLLMNLSFDEPVDVSAPAGAVKVDIKQLMTGLGSLFSGSMGEEDMADGGDPFADETALDEEFAGLD
ncbi:hypothetical protein [Streptomyces sp. NPDC057702]|uniref:hypothetical protein n=1 Tax=unclassified Streptomyces TaxID=2593676 RepID=UPI0036AF0688